MDSRAMAVVQIAIVLIGLTKINAQSRTHQCFGKYFTERLCTTGSILDVTGADFGVSMCVNNQASCCPQLEDDCTLDVRVHKSTYYDEILKKCNGRVACANLQASWVKANRECQAPNSDYVVIYYNCIRKGGSTKPATSTILPLTTSSNTTITPDNSNSTDTFEGTTTSDQGGSGGLGSRFNPTGLLLGLFASILMVGVPILIGKVIAFRKEKSKESGVETAKSPQLNSDLYEYDDDDSYDSWDEEWDDDWENMPTEELPHDKKTRKQSRQSRQSRRSRRESRKSRIEIAVVDPYVHNDSIYDVIDPTKMNYVANPRADDVIKELPKPVEPRYTKSPSRQSSQNLGSMHRRSSEPRQFMVTNTMYQSSFSKRSAPKPPKEAPPPPPPFPSEAEAAAHIQPAAEDVYMEPTDSISEAYDIADPEELYDMADSEVYANFEPAKLHMEATSRRSMQSKHPNALRQEATKGEAYWSLEHVDDSTV